VRQIHPLPIHHSWPLYERERHFELGQLHDYDTGLAIADAGRRLPPGLSRPGEWSCELAGNRLSWSREVYHIFGLPDDARMTRADSVALYCEPSRAAMEALRAYAIQHRRGFTLDAEIAPVTGARRWMRLIAAPVCEGGEVVRLQGLKFRVPTAV
jgi:PAS domain-containing protein